MQRKQKPGWQSWKPPKETKSQWRWTGFAGKTLWDWLQLLSALAIPVVLAVAGFWFSAQQDQRQQKLEDQRTANDQFLADQRTQDEALQAYLSQMNGLMLDRQLLDSAKGDTVFTLALARTTTVMQSMDAEHNRSVTSFLSESGLTGIGDHSVSLLRDAALPESLDLAGADLADANLETAVITRSNLSQASLTGANLRGSILAYSDLSQALLLDANLQDAELLEADLSEADLRGANLGDAGLVFADLKGADLSYANLKGATIDEKQLDECRSLEGATMPDGSKHN